MYAYMSNVTYEKLIITEKVFFLKFNIATIPEKRKMIVAYKDF